MSVHPIKVLEDGTRVYSNSYRYKPLAPEERKYAVRKPDDPRAVRWGGLWLLPLDVLPDDERGPVPETIPDDEAYEHMTSNLCCRCRVCLRPHAERWRRKWRKDHGLAPGRAEKISGATPASSAARGPAGR